MNKPKRKIKVKPEPLYCRKCNGTGEITIANMRRTCNECGGACWHNSK